MVLHSKSAYGTPNESVNSRINCTCDWAVFFKTVKIIKILIHTSSLPPTTNFILPAMKGVAVRNAPIGRCSTMSMQQNLQLWFILTQILVILP